MRGRYTYQRCRSEIGLEHRRGQLPFGRFQVIKYRIPVHSLGASADIEHCACGLRPGIVSKAVP